MNEIVNLLLSYSHCQFLDERVKIGNQINKLISKLELGDNDLIFSYDEDGEKKYLKTQEVQEVQNIEFQNADSKALNKDMKETPVEVVSKTSFLHRNYFKGGNYVT